MSEMIRVVVDAMGGDNAPVETVKGAVAAVNNNENISIILTGFEDAILTELAKYKYPQDRVRVVGTTQVIEMAESPTAAIRSKKDSSMVVGLRLVRDGEADAFVSAGSSGAILVGGQGIVGRIKGIERPPLAVLIPTVKGASLLIDCGANVDARSSHLVQFAQMGSIYMENIVGIKNPKVGIINIGAEDEKGNALVKETLPLLKEVEGINFIGSVEARDIPSGAADVLVCEAFTGNVVLKMFEGVSSTLLKTMKKGLLSSIRTKIGAVLIKPALKEVLKTFDVSEHGGAPILGLKGLVVKTHGNATAKQIEITIKQCVKFKEQKISEKIKENLCTEKKD